MNILTEKLKENTDPVYREFSKKLIPDTAYEIMGVRTPLIKKIAKSAVLDGTYKTFINEKHFYYEEFMLHGLILGLLKENFNEITDLFEQFLPHIDNWAICDTTVAGMKIFSKNKPEILNKIKIWLASDRPYTVRVGIVSLLDFFTTPEYTHEILSLLDGVCSDNYYVNMAASWLLSVLLIKDYSVAVQAFIKPRYNKFIHNKALQKATESFRLAEDKKSYLKSLKLKN